MHPTFKPILDGFFKPIPSPQPITRRVARFKAPLDSVAAAKESQRRDRIEAIARVFQMIAGDLLATEREQLEAAEDYYCDRENMDAMHRSEDMNQVRRG